MVNISIYLEPSPERGHVYYPGQKISGVVQLVLIEPKKFRGFYLLISGKAKCHWTERRTRSVGSGKNRRTESYTVSYDGQELYLNSKTYFFGHHGAEAIQIAAGTYKYNFMVDLPLLLPATLAGSYGSIMYKVEAVLDIPWRFDKEVEVPFTVVRHDNLNNYPELKIPLQLEKVKTFCCLFCASDPLMTTVTIPYGGYAAGQSIPMKIEYINKSDTEVELTRIKLKRTFSFTSSSPETKTKSETDKIVEIQVGGAKEGDSKKYECALEIPGIMVNSNSNFCRVVQVSYFLEVEIVVGGCHTNLKLLLPITIGSVGIGDLSTFNVPTTDACIPTPQAPMAFANQSIYPPQPSMFVPLAPTAPTVDDNDLPPTFEEAMGSSKNTIGWSLPLAPNEKM